MEHNETPMIKPLSMEEFTRLVNNFYIANNIAVDYNRIVVDSHLTNYVASHREDLKKKYKVESKKDLTSLQASTIIDNLNKLPDKTNDIPEVDINDIP